MSVGQIQRERADAAKRADIAAKRTHRTLHAVEVDSLLAAKVPSVVMTLKGCKRVAEHAVLERTLAVQGQSGSLEEALHGAQKAEQAAEKAELAVGIARYAGTLSDTPFGDPLARRLACALRAGVSVRQQPEDRIDVRGRYMYQGVGLSFGSSSKMDCPAYVNSCTSQDEVCFSVDSCWVEYDQVDPVQQCATVMIDQPLLHIGVHGLSPQELAPEVCRSLPSELKWLHEEKFISFLASNSERSLAVLLGSSVQGSISKAKIESAVLRHESYVPNSGISGTIWHGAQAFAVSRENAAEDTHAAERTGTQKSLGQTGKLIPLNAGSEALRGLANSREAVVALEQAVLHLEKQWHDGEIGDVNARDWLSQLIAQAGTIEDGVSSIEHGNLGLVCEPVKGLKRDIKRSLKQLVEYATALSDQFGRGPITDLA